MREGRSRATRRFTRRRRAKGRATYDVGLYVPAVGSALIPAPRISAGGAETQAWLVVGGRFLYRLGVWLADEIVVQTQEQAALCRQRLGRSPVVTGSLGEVVDRRSGSPEGFVWIGRLDRHKRPMAFVELARAVPEA